MTGVHRHPVRVYYEDTDFSGFVYHANYLRFLERGRTEYLRALGIDQSALHRGGGIVFVVARLGIDYLRPASMDDELVVTTTLDTLRGPIVKLVQSVSRGASVLVEAKVTVVAVKAGRPVRLPPAVRAAFGVPDPA